MSISVVRTFNFPNKTWILIKNSSIEKENWGLATFQVTYITHAKVLGVYFSFDYMFQFSFVSDHRIWVKNICFMKSAYLV